jgi:hypothetical protein
MIQYLTWSKNKYFFNSAVHLVYFFSVFEYSNRLTVKIQPISVFGFTVIFTKN